MLVLYYVSESGSAASKEVAEGLGISPKHAGMTLLRCFRRGFLSRQPYKRRRARSYVYEITDRGVEWLEYKASHRRDQGHNGIKPALDIGNEVFNTPRFQPLLLEKKHRTNRGYQPNRQLLTINSLLIHSYDWIQRYKSLKNSLNCAIYLINNLNTELACLSLQYLYLKRKFERLENGQHRERRLSSDSHQGIWNRKGEIGSYLLKVGIRIGKEGEQFRTKIKENWANFKKAQNSGMSISEPVKLASKEPFSRFSRNFNDWWNNLSVSSGSVIPH